jgi:hypothetical protein
MKDQAQLLARYRRLREVGRAVNNTLVERLPRDVLDEGGETLGLLKGNKLILDSEDEIAVLMDFCIHDIRRAGLNAIDHLLVEAPYPPGSDEAICSEALKDARFSLFLVERVEPGLGVWVKDLVREDSRLIIDVNFSRSARLGMVLAFRLIEMEGMSMTSGAALPVTLIPPVGLDPERQEGLDGLLARLARAWSREDRSEEIGTIIRSLLAAGSASRIGYEEPGKGSTTRTPKPPPGVGRYDPCPCGSGKKFKFCCGARR